MGAGRLDMAPARNDVYNAQNTIDNLRWPIGATWSGSHFEKGLPPALVGLYHWFRGLQPRVRPSQ
jgi:hypothetical protein